MIVPFKVISKALRHFNEDVTSLPLAVFITLIFLTKRHISFIRLQWPDSGVMGRFIGLQLLKDELLRQSNISSNSDIISAVPLAEGLGSPPLTPINNAAETV